MKLLRYGKAGAEKPGMLDADGKIRDLTDDEVVDHLCRRPACWNPTHLEAVTMALNTARGLGRFYQYKLAKQYG